MNTDILRSSDDLVGVVQPLMARAGRLRIASGTMFVDGFVSLCVGSGEVPIDVLVRNPDIASLQDLLLSSSSEHDLRRALESRVHPRAGTLAKAGESLRAIVRRALELMEQTPAHEAAIRTAHARIVRGDVRCRMFLQGDISTKFMLVEGADQVIVSGHDPLSATFERASVAAAVESDILAKRASRWFAEQWESAHDVSAIIAQELASSWAMASCTPYEAYLQMAIHYVGADRTVESELAWSHEIFKLLADFQRDAVRQAVRIIERHNGCFVSDVVGLGKSYIGSAILKYFEQVQGLRPLIICPAPLVDMWEELSERWELGARVVSAGMLADRSELAPAFRLENSALRSREIVLIDESHMFRNADSQRYGLLSHFVSSGRKVVLLTATPMSRRSSDVYNQMKLFHPHERTRLPISPAILGEFFHRVEDGTANLQDLLPHVLVRRTRREITRVYGRDASSGERVRSEWLDDYASGRKKARFEMNGLAFSFPVRTLETVSYSMDGTYGRGVYARIRELLIPKQLKPRSALSYARYRRLEYVLPQYRDEYRHLWGTASGLSGLMRSLLFKRLESSTAAFLGTVSRMRAAVSGLIRFLVDPSTHHLEIDELRLDGAAEEDAQIALEESERAVSINHLDRDRFAADLRADHEILALLEALVKPVRTGVNSKMLALRRLIEANRLQSGKLLIFSEFTETAELVAAQLKDWFPESVVDCCTGGSGNRGRIPVRFSPLSNKASALRSGEREIDMLVSTDVLSEGVNLQDCNVVINFDLHWNPVRLIQRFGRVDRIGSLHGRILAYNFLPETELDANLGLRARLDERIREIHEVIGEDSAILDPSEKLNERAMYAIYEGKTLSDEELSGSLASSAVQEALGLLGALREESPSVLAEIAARPLGQRASRTLSGPSEVAYTLLRCGTETRFYRCGKWIASSHVSAEVALKEVACLPEEPSRVLPDWIGEAVADARKRFLLDVEERAGDWYAPQRMRDSQRTVVERLAAMADGTSGNDLSLERLEELQRMLRADLPDAVVRSLRVLNQRSLPDSAFLDELSRLCLSHHLHRRPDLLPQAGSLAIEVIATVAFVEA